MVQRAWWCGEHPSHFRKSLLTLLSAVIERVKILPADMLWVSKWIWRRNPARSPTRYPIRARLVRNFLERKRHHEYGLNAAQTSWQCGINWLVRKRVTNATTLPGLENTDWRVEWHSTAANHEAHQQLHEDAVPGGGAGTWVIHPILSPDHVIEINEQSWNQIPVEINMNNPCKSSPCHFICLCLCCS